MRLYFLRHAIAVPRGTPGYAVDADRPLTPKGIRKMERIAMAMKAMDLSFDIILSSPYLRARHTAEIAAAILKLKKKLKLMDALEAEKEPHELIQKLKEGYSSLESILLVGHEPHMSSCISLLVAGKTGAEIVLKKGGLCRLSADELQVGQCAALEWLLQPRQLTLMA